MIEQLGLKLAQIREDKNVTVKELAENSSIAESQINLIEQGEFTPSMTTLVKISRSLGVRVGTFLDGEENSSPVCTTTHQSTAVVSPSTSSENACSHINLFSLAQGKADRNMEPMIVNVTHTTQETEFSNHEGEEFFYVLEGKVELRYGSDKYTLNPGDSIYFDSIIPHCLTTENEGEQAKVLAVLYAPF